MQCISRETGRFHLAHDGYPSGSLASFIRNRCGSVPIGVSTIVQPLEADWTEQQALQATGDWLKSLMANTDARTEVGIWYGGEEDGSKSLISVALGRRNVELEPTPFGADPEGVVELRGTVLDPTSQVGGSVTFGAFDYKGCATDADVALPKFVVRCRTQKTDRHARASFAYKVSESSIQSIISFDALFWPAGGADSNVYEAPETKVASPGPDGAANAAGLAERFVELVNTVRARAQRPPLKLEELQTATATRALPHLMLAEREGEHDRSDKILLGLLAGWDVKGDIVNGTFARRGGSTGEIADLVDEFLESPGGRMGLLDAEAGSVAVAVDKGSDGGRTTVMATSYFFLPKEHRNKRLSRVIERLDEARAAFNSPPVRRDKKLYAKSKELSEQLENGQISLEDAVDEFMEKAATVHRGKQVRGSAWWGHDLDDLQFHKAMLVKKGRPKVGVVVAPVRFPGYPWIMYGVIVVYAERPHGAKIVMAER